MKLPQIFKRAPLPVRSQPLQTSRYTGHPFGLLDRYVPLSKGEFALYDSIREAVPIVDAAIGKIVALVGGFSVECEDPRFQNGLEEFLANVPVGCNLYGIDAFIAQHFEQLLMYGTSVGEILPTLSGGDIAALHNGLIHSKRKACH